MSEKQTPNVPSAEAQKPNAEAAPQLNVAEIKSKIPKAFQKYVEPLMQWAKSIDDRLALHETYFKQINESLPETIKQKMTESLNEMRTRSVPAQEPSQGVRSSGTSVGDVVSFLDQTGLMGGQSNVMSQKAEQLMSTLLDQAILNATKKSRVEELLDEEIAKTKAKAIAASLTP